jgi:hypothetical protein
MFCSAIPMAWNLLFKKLKGANMNRTSSIQGLQICAAFLIFVVLTSGCAVGPKVRAYSGDKLQKSEVTVIKGWYYFTPLYYDRVDIYMIDGSYPKATKVEILPGWHELVIRNYVISLSPLGPVPGCLRAVRAAFDFEAGHEYRIKTQNPFRQTEGVKIIDVTTGAIIFSQPWSACPDE